MLREQKRRKGKKHLIPFTQYTNPTYKPAQHHHLIAEKLERVEAGDCKRLMIFMPPRHGKSELASRRFPAWYLGRNPMKQIIASSYSTDLAEEFGRNVRDIVRDSTFSDVFDGISLSPDAKAIGRWNTTTGGIYKAAGVGKGISGFGADVFLIDDPVKDHAEADSDVYRDRVWNWYTSTAYTRLMPGASIVLIMTRWHDDDLAGRLLEEQKKGGDTWEVLTLPAINEAGEALWPEWFDIEKLKQTEKVVGPRDWTALYQQEPIPEGGSFFQKSWVQWYEVPPKHLRKYGASDYAVTEGDGDWTVHGIAGIDPNDDMYILDWYREQADPDDWIDELFDMAATHKPVEWGEEKGQIIKSLNSLIRKRQQEERNYFHRVQYPSTTDKAQRAQAIRGRMAQGKVFFPRTEWARKLIAELLRFPAGKHDDQVDVLGLFGRMLDTMIKAKGEDEEEKPKFPQERTFDEIRDSITKRRKEQEGWD
jgi:predicted phage terminase large subunit-like protein